MPPPTQLNTTQQATNTSMHHISHNVSLRPYNTFGIEVNAKEWAIAETLDDWHALIAYQAAHRLPLLLLGGGSNVLLTKNFNGLVVKNNLKGIEVLNEDNEGVRIKIAGGENWHDLVLWAVERNYGGIENLSLIPGTVGAAPVQNIGAYGVELKDVLVELEAMDLQTAEHRRFLLDQCKFGYRDSIFKNDLKGRYVIVSVTLQLSKNPVANLSYAELEVYANKKGIPHPSIQQVSQWVCEIRQQKLPNPAELGNAGSFFKNPIISRRHFLALQDEFPALSGYPVSETQVKISAAWLVEQTGWKGKRIGDAGVYARHALILVNHGNATGNDISSLAFDILDAVRQKFNIVIVPEVNIL